MEESNPWPTFVDAFSTVLCIFIFLMLVFVLNSMLVMYDSSKKNYAASSKVYQEKQQQLESHPQYGGKGMESMQEDVVQLAETNRKQGTVNGQSTGRFDVSDTSPVWESKGNQFIVHFKGMEQGYSAAVISDMEQWLGANEPVSIAVYTYITSSVAISDAMRLAYERGVILLKKVKSKHPKAEVSISVVNDASTLTNSTVITKSE